MARYEITFIYPTQDASQDRSQSLPLSFDASSLEDAKRTAEAMIESESTGHRTVKIGVLTHADDRAMEITRWVRNEGWQEA